MALTAKETIFLTGPAGKLETLVARPAEGEIRGTLTFVHPNPTEGGTNTNKVVTTVAKAFCKKGYACLLPNMRGPGDSDGAYADGAGEKDDAQAVFEAAKAMFPQARRRALGGFSFGGFVATLAAGACEPDFLILVAPAVNRHALKSPRDVALRFDTRLFFGSEDDVVPPGDVLPWAEAQSLPVVTIAGAGHFFHRKLADLEKAVELFCPF